MEQRKIVVVFSKWPLKEELDPFKNDPELILINSALRIEGVNKKPQILEGTEGIIFYHNIDAMEIRDIMKIIPSEIAKLRVLSYDERHTDTLGIQLFKTLNGAFDKMKELLG